MKEKDFCIPHLHPYEKYKFYSRPTSFFSAIIMQKRLSLLSLALAAAVTLASCGGGKSGSAADSTAAATSNNLTGAGSTFINPIMTNWASEYQKEDSVAVNYQSVGSGAGINN